MNNVKSYFIYKVRNENVKIKKQSVLTKLLSYYKNTLYGRSDRVRTCGIDIPNMS